MTCPACGGEVQAFDLLDPVTADEIACWDCALCQVQGFVQDV